MICSCPINMMQYNGLKRAQQQLKVGYLILFQHWLFDGELISHMISHLVQKSTWCYNKCVWIFFKAYGNFCKQSFRPVQMTWFTLPLVSHGDCSSLSTSPLHTDWTWNMLSLLSGNLFSSTTVTLERRISCQLRKSKTGEAQQEKATGMLCVALTKSFDQLQPFFF